MTSKQTLLEQAAQKYDSLQFKDDFLFCKILEKRPDITKELLELILKIKIKKVEVQKQAAIELTADGRGIRLDVYVEDDANTVYDLEMQTTPQKFLPKRTRYYQGMIDLNSINRGAKFSELKKTYIIFICMEDPFADGRHIYTFENMCKENPKLPLNDEAVKVFLNSTGTVDDVSDELKEIFTLLNTGTSTGTLAQKISKEVEIARLHEEWRLEFMTLFMREQEKYDAGVAYGKRLMIENALESGSSPEQIANIMNIDLNFVNQINNDLHKNTITP